VTCAHHPNLYLDECAILPALRDRGVDARAIAWDDPAVDWATFRAIVLRSPWDYFRKYGEFLAWLDRVERAAPVFNPAPLVRWNVDKVYLRDLEQKGIRIVPTAFCDAGKPARLDAILAERGWSEAVVKPAISGGSYRTYRVSAGTGAAANQAHLEEILGGAAALIQPFLPEIQTEGEWSLVFFDGVFSHAVLKVPGAGDYRVQEELGGTFKQVTPPPEIMRDAQSVLAALPMAPAYARIDGVRRQGHFLLMEAELVEPYLYLAAAPGSLERYVALLERLASRGSQAR
jgi:glutathione synthase/RimK-type ligase-like ATP-grasp enzyme